MLILSLSARLETCRRIAKRWSLRTFSDSESPFLVLTMKDDGALFNVTNLVHTRSQHFQQDEALLEAL